MQVKDVMTTKVITAKPDASVTDIAKLLIKHRISGIPIVDEKNALVGIISESDLMRRPETKTERHSSWWLHLIQDPTDQALTYIKSHGRHAKDVMTRDIATVSEDTSLDEIAQLLEGRRIKRVPVLRDGKLVGIISRADLLRALAGSKQVQPSSTDEQELRKAAESAIEKHAGFDAKFVSVVVSNDVARIWGGVELPATKDAARIAVENVPGITAVEDNVNVFPAAVRTVFWAE
jgi:CBS domain-containing protein